jgi:hypothetical protein
MQSAQSVSAAYYFDVAARDYTLAAGAIELVVEGVPCSAFIEPSQSCELIFRARLDRLRGRKHAGDGGKFCRDLQEPNGHAMKGESVSWLIQSVARHLGGRNAHFGLLQKVYVKRAKIRGQQLKLAIRRNEYSPRRRARRTAADESHKAENKTTDDYKN